MEKLSNMTRGSCTQKFLLWLLTGTLFISCGRPSREETESAGRTESHVAVKKRADGSISSVNQVDDLNRVHGVRVTYYEDGKTVYSKTTFEHGIKNGPLVRYYRNGQMFEHTRFNHGKANGPTRKYYMNGDLMAEFSSENGLVLPGLKEYARDGTLISEYPEVRFQVVDHLKEGNRIDLLIYCEPSVYPVKYYRTQPGTEHKDRVYLISERGKASLQFYVKPGDTLEEEVEVTAEIPTELGNTLVRYVSYPLHIRN